MQRARGILHPGTGWSDWMNSCRMMRLSSKEEVKADQHGFERSKWDVILEALCAFLCEGALPECEMLPGAETKSFRSSLKRTGFEMTASEVRAAAEGALALTDLRFATLVQAMTMYRRLATTQFVEWSCTGKFELGTVYGMFHRIEARLCWHPLELWTVYGMFHRIEVRLCWHPKLRRVDQKTSSADLNLQKCIDLWHGFHFVFFHFK